MLRVRAGWRVALMQDVHPVWDWPILQGPPYLVRFEVNPSTGCHAPVSEWVRCPSVPKPAIIWPRDIDLWPVAGHEA